MLFRRCRCRPFSSLQWRPCTYEDRPFKATIVSIEKSATPSPYERDTTSHDFGYRVKLMTNLPHRDTLYLDEMKEEKITQAFLEAHNFSTGRVLEGIAHVRTSGTCAPGGYRFADSTLNIR